MFGDVFAMLFCALCLVFTRLSLNWFGIMLLALLPLAVIQLLFLGNFDYFNLPQYINSFLKLAAYVFTATIAVFYYSDPSDPERLEALAQCAQMGVFICCLFGWIIYAMDFQYIYTGVSDFHKYLYFGYAAPLEFGFPGNATRTFEGFVVPKLRGFFLEPSHFVTFVGFFGILVARFSNLRTSLEQHFFLMISLVLTLSLTGFVFLGLYAVAAGLSIKFNRKLLVYLIGFSFLLLILSNFIFEGILLRSLDALQAADRSTVYRWWRSLAALDEIFVVSPLFGAGFGQIEYFIQTEFYYFDVGDPRLLRVAPAVQVSYLYIFAAAGLLGATYVVALFLCYRCSLYLRTCYFILPLLCSRGRSGNRFSWDHCHGLCFHFSTG